MFYKSDLLFTIFLIIFLYFLFIYLLISFWIYVAKLLSRKRLVH